MRPGLFTSPTIKNLAPSASRALPTTANRQLPLFWEPKGPYGVVVVKAVQAVRCPVK